MNVSLDIVCPSVPVRPRLRSLRRQLDVLWVPQLKAKLALRAMLVPRAMLVLAAMLALAEATCCGVAVADDVLDYSRDIRPILSDNCFRCHGPDDATREADLRLDTFEGATAETSGGHAITPGDPAGSEVLTRILTQDADLRMPPVDSGKSLSTQQIDLLQQWIRQGANYSQHWSFRPILRPEVPEATSKWPINSIDNFVLRQLHAKGIEPAQQAERTTLIRRVHLDVTGLPPTLEEIDQFVLDDSADAYSTMVDRALTSPHYGERWGRHWLDHARYADTHGYTVDGERTMWPYRDWVINALNDDLPFDQFTIEQLAGDLLPTPSRSQLVATGFHRNTLINQEGGTDAEQFRNEAVVDRVNTTGAVWLGLTVGCAQCHTHKYDPITHHEYYQLFAFFNQGRDVNSVSPTLKLPSEQQSTQLKELDAALAEVKSQLAAINRPSKDAPAEADLAVTTTAELDTVAGSTASDIPEKSKMPDKSALEARQKALEADRKKLLAAIPETMVMGEIDKARQTHVLIRGDFLRHGDVVNAETPRELPPMPNADSPRTRLDLARWLVDPQNPLTARVTLNRIWARYFGRGLVETENDFGFQGTPPSHPELLDWLAAEWMESSWSLKHMHRLILNSATYRQSSAARSDIQAVDPLNRLLARQVRLRVDAEVVRDIGLAVSGLLNPAVGGPSVYPPQPEGVYAFTQRNAAWPVSKGKDRYRRGMYTFFMRSAPYPMLTTFDTPRFDTTCTMRVRSNTPLQSLTMANDEAMLEMAQALGQRLQSLVGTDADRIELAFRLCFARPPLPRESQRLQDYVLQQRLLLGNGALPAGDTPPAADTLPAADTPPEIADAEARVWMLVGRTLMNLDEFIVRE